MPSMVLQRGDTIVLLKQFQDRSRFLSVEISQSLGSVLCTISLGFRREAASFPLDGFFSDCLFP